MSLWVFSWLAIIHTSLRKPAGKPAAVYCASVKSFLVYQSATVYLDVDCADTYAATTVQGKLQIFEVMSELKYSNVVIR